MILLLLFSKVLAVFVIINSSLADLTLINMPQVLKISIQDVGVLETNAEYLSAELSLKNANTDSSMLDINLHCIKAIPQTSQISIYLQKETGKGEYSNIGVPIKKRVCEFILQDKLFYPDFVKAGNFLKKCPLLPGEYYVKNYVINRKEFPAVMPAGKFRILLHLDIDSKTPLWWGYAIINIAN